jgi:16S rRNA (uracil1498-N3)-methyltransferase
MSADGVVLTLEREIHGDSESPLALTLAVAQAKAEAMEMVMRQATELGVRTIAPFTSTYSEKLPAERTARRLSRWSKIIREALKSCQRAWLPTLQPVQDFMQVLTGPEDMKLFCWENQRGGGLASLLTGPPPQGVRVVIGPEGGFTPAEASQAREAGCHLVSLGPRRLKVETAALTILALIQGAWGDLA